MYIQSTSLRLSMWRYIKVLILSLGKNSSVGYGRQAESFVDINPAVRIFLARHFKKRALRGLVPEALPAIIGTTRGASKSFTSSNARRARGCPGANGRGRGRSRETTRDVSSEIPEPRSRSAEMAIVTAATTARVSARKNAARRRHASPHGRRTCAQSAIERRSRSGARRHRQREAPRNRVTPATIEWSRREIDAQVRIRRFTRDKRGYGSIIVMKQGARGTFAVCHVAGTLGRPDYRSSPMCDHIEVCSSLTL